MARLIRSVLFVQKVLLVVCSLLIAVTFGVVVVLRYGFQMNLFAYEEWMMAAAFTLYFIGSAQGSFDNTHIKADLLKEWIRSEAAKRWVDARHLRAGGPDRRRPHLLGLSDGGGRSRPLPGPSRHARLQHPAGRAAGRHPPRLRADDPLLGDALRPPVRPPAGAVAAADEARGDAP